MIYQGSLTLLALVILLVLIFLVIDQHPKPPIKAQALLRQKNKSVVKQLTFAQHIKVYVQEMKFLFSDFTFANIILSLSILYTTNISKIYSSANCCDQSSVVIFTQIQMK